MAALRLHCWFGNGSLRGVLVGVRRLGQYILKAMSVEIRGRNNPTPELSGLRSLGVLDFFARLAWWPPDNFLKTIEFDEVIRLTAKIIGNHRWI